MTPTKEQQDIIAAANASRQSMMIRAYAGTGKTTMLKLLSAELKEPGLAIAFNVKIAKSLSDVMPSSFDVRTFNGLGHRAWAAATGRRLEVDGYKMGKIVTQILKQEQIVSSSEEWDAIRRLATAAQHKGLIPNHQNLKSYLPNALAKDNQETWIDIAEDELWQGASPQIIALARAALIENILQAFKGIVSYDDQVYCSALLGGRFDKYPLVLVDESQDVSPLNIEQIKRSASDRIIVVGDELQSVYAFRGADAQAIPKLRALREEWIDLPLTVTFRCPKVMVRRNAHYAVGFQAFETNKEGQSLNWRPNEYGEIWHDEIGYAVWSWHWIPTGGDVAIICRNNAPLLGMAFKLLRRGIGVQMLGRDIGKNLVTLSKKICPKDQTPLADVIHLVNDWKRRERQLAEANQKPHLVAGIEDRAECLLAVAEAQGIKTAQDLRRALELLFGRTVGRVTLTSGHRCVHPQTLVETPLGLMEIKDIPENGFISTPTVPQEYVGKFVRAKEKTIKITTVNGFSLEMSPDHGISIWGNGVIVKRRAEELRVRQIVRLKIGTSFEITEYQQMHEPTSGNIRETVFRTPKFLNEELAEFLGMFVADGTLYRKGFRLKKRHKDVVERFSALANCMFGTHSDVAETPNENSWETEVPSTFLSKWLEGIKGISPNAKSIPKAILRSPLSVQAAFLKGLFEDGTVNTDGDRVDHLHLDQNSGRMLEIVQIMLLRFGIKSTLKHRQDRSIIYIYGESIGIFASKIGFVSSAKQKKATELFCGEDRNSFVPVTRDEVKQIKDYITFYEKQNANARGYISKRNALKIMHEEKAAFLRDRVDWLWQKIDKIESGLSETICVEVPNGGRFLQNSFDGWNSKGLEWPVVLHLDPFRIPSKYAQRSEAQMKQELNLLYVITTRTKDIYIEANLEDFES